MKLITQVLPAVEDKSLVRLDPGERFPERLCEQVREYLILHPLPAVHTILEQYDEAYVPEPHNYQKTNDFKPYVDTEHPTPAALSREDSLVGAAPAPAPVPATTATATGPATATGTEVAPTGQVSRVDSSLEPAVRSRAPSPTPPASVPAHVSPANEPLVHTTSHLVHTVSHVEHPAAHKPHEHETHVPAPVAAPAPAPAPVPVHHKHHDPPAVSHPPETNTNSAAVSAKYNAAQTNYKLAHTAAAHSDDKAVDKRLTELNKALDNKIGRGDFDQLKSMVQELMYTSMTREEADAMLDGVFRPDDILSPVGGKGAHRSGSMVAVDPRSAKLRSCIEQVSRSIVAAQEALQVGGNHPGNAGAHAHGKPGVQELSEDLLKEIQDEVEEKLFNERRRHEKESERLTQEIHGLRRELESLDVQFQNRIQSERGAMETLRPELARLSQMVTVITEEHKLAADTVLCA